MVGIPINMEVVIRNLIRRERIHKGVKFGFGSLMTRFLRVYDIEQGDIDVRLPQNTRAINVTTSKKLDTQHVLTLSTVERNARTISYHSHM